VGVQQFGPLELLAPDDWQWVLSVNVIGTANTVAAFLPLLRAADGPRHIVLTSSVAALAPSPRQGAYIASKFAVTGYGEVSRRSSPTRASR
jgi:NAD(P)-dependent dehydrogenase (short-subunit alcohol dehydrogenase family)